MSSAPTRSAPTPTVQPPQRPPRPTGGEDQPDAPGRHRRRQALTFVTALAAACMSAAAWAARLAWKGRTGLVLAGAYFTLGAYLVRHSDLLVLDALSRQAHAFMVWHNGPPKLAGLGFVWPPVTTLTLLPATMVRSFGSTGLAAPLVSALVMAGLVVLVWRELVHRGLGRPLAALTAIALAAHPMIVYYGANGMGEAWGLLLPAISLVGLTRWYDTRSITALSVASFAAGLAMLARYELALLPPIACAAVVAITLVEERDWPKARALALFFLLPTIYLAGVWMFFNWAVQGSPIWFLTGGGQVATVAGTAATIGGPKGLQDATRLDGLLSIVRVQLLLAPALPLVLAGLVAWAAWARRPFALFVAAIVAVNVATTAGILALTGNQWMTQLRFNMRAIPLVIVAGVWLAQQVARGRGGDRAGPIGLTVASVLRVALVAGVALAIPASVHLMATHDVQFTEQAFLRAVTTGERMTGATTLGEQNIGCQGARDMANYIAGLQPTRNSILADDSSTYAVMMFSRHPEWFIDRVDKGDAYFIDQLARPARRIDYLLASDYRFCAGVSSDLVGDRFGTDPAATTDNLRPVHETRGFRLYRVLGRLDNPT